MPEQLVKKNKRYDHITISRKTPRNKAYILKNSLLFTLYKIRSSVKGIWSIFHFSGFIK